MSVAYFGLMCHTNVATATTTTATSLQTLKKVLSCYAPSIPYQATYAEVCPEAVVDGLPPFVYGVAHGINTWCDTQLARMATEKAAEEAEKASQEEAEAPEEYEETPEGSGGESEDEESSATIGKSSRVFLRFVYLNLF